MKKILYFITWSGCIILLSCAYEDYLYSQFKVDTAQGIVEDKWVGKTTRNIFGNFTEEREYWIQLNGEKIVVTKAIYEEVNRHRQIKLTRTQHGMLIE
ncbi:hypothetical protein G3A_06870 [Bacillus sp. 17376]|uniref:Lipoprotein n=1 Tax=Mesobacillus boroniphilus JCM 21738 TaxID=1294265 RepID=W4RK41_9BACI|nr:hypothetical protein [Mesobacillus boroniphilus]ESU33309.1 hypothetical protein G3A_06870 [Bacillus sp. 17376]GAE44815.1 hypothetical protein JCM21738_1561 [Mesobacillus boroniphilus JCM 21738]